MSASLRPERFVINVPQADVDDLMYRVRNHRPVRLVYESTTNDKNPSTSRSFGIKAQWMEETIVHWQTSFDWRECEQRMNEYNNFLCDVPFRGSKLKIHYIEHRSPQENAIPLVLLHGWPGSFTEFLPMIPYLAKSTSPAFHIIIPSYPGFAWSDPPPLDANFEMEDCAEIIDTLLRGIGYSQYVCQGGDLGASIARIMSIQSNACLAVHLNIWFMQKPDGVTDELPADEQRNVDKMANVETGCRRFLCTSLIAAKISSATDLSIHSSKPATIGYAIACDPVSILAWTGDKFLDWAGIPLSIPTILEIVSLFWLTGCIPSTIWHYRQIFGPEGQQPYFQKKSFGYSYFVDEVWASPIAWVATTGNMVWHKKHARGGHFPSWECPKILAQDCIECFGQILSAPQAAEPTNKLL